MTHVIRRKLKAGNRIANPDSRADARGEAGGNAERHWRLAFARAARDAASLDVELSGSEMAQRSLAEVLDLPAARAFLCVLEGPDQSLGFLSLSPEVLAMLIEIQTTGRLSKTERDSRKPTRTDAAMVAGLVDQALAAFGKAMMATPAQAWGCGYSYASFLEDARPLGLLLEDEVFSVLMAEVMVPGNPRHGKVLLVLPAQSRARQAVRPNPIAPADPGPAFAEVIGDAIMGSEAVLNAVLDRVTLPLNSVFALNEGDVLPLPLASIDRLRIESMDGHLLSSARLGQNRGMRAIRVSEVQGNVAASPTTVQPVEGAVYVPPEQIAGAA